MKNICTVKIGQTLLSPALMLSPMAGVGDLAFREICEDNGASYTCTEMVSSKALCFSDKKTASILQQGRNKLPFSVQIFGSEPTTMAKAAKIALEISGAVAVDINMGCPMPKIVSNGDGSALMRNPQLAYEIIYAVKNAVDVPVTVKHRAGWNASQINAVSFAQNAQNAGADAICIHGRTASQLYSGTADRKIIADVKNAVTIPVFANGDICTAQDAIDMIAQTNADGLAIGRGALGNPWLFDQIRRALNGETNIPDVDFVTRLQTSLKQMRLAATYKGERVAVLEARRHMCWYLKNVAGAKAFKTKLCTISKLSDAEALVCQMENLFQQYGTLNIEAE